MKNVQEANQTSESVDEELKFIFNVLNGDRKLRREMLAHYKSGGDRHLHTSAQITKMCEQALASLDRYSPEAMMSTPGRRRFSGALKRADAVTAERGRDEKNKKKAKSSAAEETAGDLSARREAAHAAPLAVEAAAAAIQAIAPRQRIFAVVMEEKISGQVNGEAVFWSKVPGGVSGLKAEVKTMLPLVHGFIDKVENNRRELLSKADKTIKTVVIRRQMMFVKKVVVWEGIPIDTGDWVVKPQHEQHPPREVVVKAEAQAVLGLLSTTHTFRRFFLARESPWKPGTGPVVGQVRCESGEVRRGFACRWCLRDPNFGSSSPPAPPTNLQHWGSVACFLNAEERAGVAFLFMNTRTTSTFAAKTAAARKGGE